jgi:hypothetical protein
MSIVMQMLTTATPSAAETAGIARLHPMERNEKAKLGRRIEATEAPSDWRSRMELTIQLQVQDPTQLHQTVGHLANLLEARAAREKA